MGAYPHPCAFPVATLSRKLLSQASRPASTGIDRLNQSIPTEAREDALRAISAGTSVNQVDFQSEKVLRA